MASDAQTHIFTVRFPDNLHQAFRASAARQGKSCSALLQDIAETYLSHEEERRLFDSFTRLVENFNGSEITLFQQVELSLEASKNLPTRDE